MADDKMTDAVDDVVSKAAGLPTERSKVKVDTGPSFRMVETSKIPVSKAEGSLWKSRKDASMAAMKNTVAAWKEAEAYYSIGQDVHREDTGGDSSGNARVSRNKGRRFTSTENVVYSNINAILPAILAKNPQAEITAFIKELSAKATMYEHLVNRLAQMKAAPGFNLKPKLRKCILRTEITNEAWVLVGYTKKEDSAEQARKDLVDIGEKLKVAKTQQEITELEGQLLALEEVVDILNPSGPFVTTVSADKVHIDPTSTEDDFSDAKWKMVEVMLPTRYLLAKYAEKGENGEYKAVYEKQYIINPGNTGEDNVSEFNSVRLLKESDSFANAGFSSQESYNKSLMTKCFYCFDRVKRRFLLYADEKWEWPLWVYDDPYQFPGFYPIFRLQYNSDPTKNRVKGEVSHYLDQQDEINEINTEVHWMRTQLYRKVIYNSKYVSETDVEKLMKGADFKALAFNNLPEGMKINDVIMAPPLPNMQYKELFNKEDLYHAIDRIGTANDVIRGAQFKTNTTNQAIDTYNSIQNQRLDEKIDAIEDFSGDIFYAVMFLCAQFMTAEEVVNILGQEAAGWQQTPPEELRRGFACTVMGGSTQKPTSAVKKDQALKIGQILGQFASATPEVTMVMLKIFEQAFDDVVITADDWASIRESIQAKLMQGMSAPPQQGSGDPSQPQSNDETAEATGNGTSTDSEAPSNEQETAELEMAIQKMPKQAQDAIKMAEEKGVPRHQAFKAVAQELQKRPLPVEQPTTTH